LSFSLVSSTSLILHSLSCFFPHSFSIFRSCLFSSLSSHASDTGQILNQNVSHVTTAYEYIDTPGRVTRYYSTNRHTRTSHTLLQYISTHQDESHVTAVHIYIHWPLLPFAVSIPVDCQAHLVKFLLLHSNYVPECSYF
jgi:hypothetical protein